MCVLAAVTAPAARTRVGVSEDRRTLRIGTQTRCKLMSLSPLILGDAMNMANDQVFRNQRIRSRAVEREMGEGRQRVRGTFKNPEKWVLPHRMRSARSARVGQRDLRVGRRL